MRLVDNSTRQQSLEFPGSLQEFSPVEYNKMEECWVARFRAAGSVTIASRWANRFVNFTEIPSTTPSLAFGFASFKQDPSTPLSGTSSGRSRSSPYRIHRQNFSQVHVLASSTFHVSQSLDHDSPPLVLHQPDISYAAAADQAFFSRQHMLSL